MGRPSARERTAFGQRLLERRELARLTQAEVAQQLGLSQRAYAAWERDAVAILPERLSSVAAILGTTTGELLGESSRRIRTPNGSNASTSRLGRTFEIVGKLPRRQQAKILDVVDALLAQQAAEAPSS